MARNWRLAKLDRAIAQLEQVLEAPLPREPWLANLQKAGCIQYFEFSFELAWKTIKELVTAQGLEECYSPRSCLKQAYALGWLQDQSLWLEMMEGRNRMSHTYSAEAAVSIYDRLGDYCRSLRQLHGTLLEVEA